jgi:hypothetical protein
MPRTAFVRESPSQALPAAAVLVCPDCPTARVVQASVFDGRFWPHLFLVALPLLILGLFSALLYRVGNGGRGARQPHQGTKQ